MLTKAQKAILSTPPILGQQEQELLQNHTSPEPWAVQWRAERLQEVRNRNNDQGARYMTLGEITNLVLGTPLEPSAKVYIVRTTLTVLGSKPVLGNQPVEGYNQGTRIIFMAQGELERSLHTWAHVFIFDYLRQDSSIGSAFMEALYSWVVHDWRWQWGMRWDSLLARLLWADRAFPISSRNERLRVWRLANGYIYGAPGIPDGFWKGGAWSMKDVEEAYASLFSACRGRMELLPPSLRVYYRGMVGG